VKVTKWVDLGSKEVEIEIGREDIHEALAVSLSDDVSDQSPYSIRSSLNTISGFLNAIDDQQIAEQSIEVRKIVSAFFLKAAARWSA